MPDSNNISYLASGSFSQTAERFWFEQRVVPRLIKQSGAHVLLSPGNFAIWNSPVPQILLSRNALYTSRQFETDLRARGESRMWMDHQLKKLFAKWSIAIADRTVAPSEAFAQELRQWTGQEITAIHHGFDLASFTADASPLPSTVQEKLHSRPDALRLLFLSHYNYYRNFETLFHAVPLIKRRLAPRSVTLLLSCKLATGANPGTYRTDAAAALLRDLGISHDVVELGTVPYPLLHHIYRSADIYVSPAYAESFAHPLVEAMSTRLPVVASRLPVHREICGPAALYFDAFSPEQLTERVVELALSADLRATLAAAAVERSAAFSWKVHVDRILQEAEHLLARKTRT